LALVLYSGFAIPTTYMRGWISWIRYLNPVSSYPAPESAASKVLHAFRYILLLKRCKWNTSSSEVRS
jgi:hypothetical protein